MGHNQCGHSRHRTDYTGTQRGGQEPVGQKFQRQTKIGAPKSHKKQMTVGSCKGRPSKEGGAQNKRSLSI